ncbi:50S ribosomal protein L4 [Candidatus Woesebacteria bacterium RIFCSPHIGHO2_01_FULL_38_26b]|uniref:Large ribosomal subunit protein uL4 n=1 Tax=Candidatus Woesebacteria bacterium RIFCSPHIGHO2_01_FULL_38_26b TaxID=1802491 RepID=A0A1F7XWP0_9BACT|nr:MAG: 50S ribosomal protein L4 [Candidatus Woesebacteria bacterium RIFCSPHIGHO2_01_FULL_38_26b]
MLKIPVYTQLGSKKEDMTMPRDWEIKVNRKLLSQAVRVYQDRKHPGFSKVKTRGEVKSSTRKIYKQKGTGGARHGARSAPIFVGGGIAHGPKGVKRKLKLSKDIKQQALKSSLSLKATVGKLYVVEGISKLVKTKDAFNMFGKIALSQKIDKNPRFTMVLSEKNKDALRTLRNLRDVKTVFYRNLNAFDTFVGGNIIVDKDVLETQPKKIKNAVIKPTSTKKDRKSSQKKIVAKTIKSRVAKKVTKKK